VSFNLYFTQRIRQGVSK